MKTLLDIAAIVPVTEAEGPGKRFAIWVQGCPFRCPGCCNPQYLPYSREPSQRTTVENLVNKIAKVKVKIEGVTFIGGEPFSQAQGLTEVAAASTLQGLSVMVFTGYTFQELNDANHPEFAERQALLTHTDLLVDGRYQRENHETTRRWIGSSNQKIYFLTDRYRHLAERWPTEGNTIEIRLVNGELTINGFPHTEITRLSNQSLRNIKS